MAGSRPRSYTQGIGLAVVAVAAALVVGRMLWRSARSTAGACRLPAATWESASASVTSDGGDLLELAQGGTGRFRPAPGGPPREEARFDYLVRGDRLHLRYLGGATGRKTLTFHMAAGSFPVRRRDPATGAWREHAYACKVELSALPYPGATGDGAGRTFYGDPPAP